MAAVVSIIGSYTTLGEGGWLNLGNTEFEDDTQGMSARIGDPNIIIRYAFDPIFRLQRVCLAGF